VGLHLEEKSEYWIALWRQHVVDLPSAQNHRYGGDYFKAGSTEFLFLLPEDTPSCAKGSSAADRQSSETQEVSRASVSRQRVLRATRSRQMKT